MRILISKSNPSDSNTRKRFSVLKTTSKFLSSRPCFEEVVSSSFSISLVLIVCIRQVVCASFLPNPATTSDGENSPKMFKTVVVVVSDKKLECLDLSSQIFAASTRYWINAQYVISELSVSLC